MSLLSESSPQLAGKAVLLSVKPRFANLITSGFKQVEFRRVWAKDHVPWMAIYSSAPVQQIVSIVEIEAVTVATERALWDLNVRRGGDLSRTELRHYFSGRTRGFALMLGRVLTPKSPINPAQLADTFRAPQSFRYLTDSEVGRLHEVFRL